MTSHYPFLGRDAVLSNQLKCVADVVDSMDAVKAFAAGKPVLLFDSSDREGEVDLVVHAGAVTPALVAQIRCDAGGLICLAVGKEVAAKLGLPFMADILRSNPATKKLVLGKMPYGGQSAFSLSINAKGTFTGITDKDRARTIAEFSRMCAKPDKGVFESKFYSPGHVPLLVSRGIGRRQGHTELAVELCKRAGRSECAVLCEMLDAQTGGALSTARAKEYGRRLGLAFAEGRQFI